MSGAPLKARVTFKSVEAVDSPFGNSLPAHQRATLTAPTLRNFTNETQHTERYSYVTVLSLKSLKSYWSKLIEDSDSGTRFNELEKTLFAAARGGPMKTDDGVIYDFPSINAAQVATGSLARLSTQQFQGYRFLAWYTQDGYRASKYEIGYNFIGLTRDGKNLIVVHLPYEVPTLPSPEKVQQAYAKESGNMSEVGVNQLLQALKTKLAAEARTGRLSPFDAVVKSIQIR